MLRAVKFSCFCEGKFFKLDQFEGPDLLVTFTTPNNPSEVRLNTKNSWLKRTENLYCLLHWLREACSSFFMIRFFNELRTGLLFTCIDGRSIIDHPFSLQSERAIDLRSKSLRCFYTRVLEPHGRSIKGACCLRDYSLELILTRFLLPTQIWPKTQQ